MIWYKYYLNQFEYNHGFRKWGMNDAFLDWGILRNWYIHQT